MFLWSTYKSPPVTHDIESSAPYIPLGPTDTANQATLTWKKIVMFGIVLLLVGAAEVAFAAPAAIPGLSRALSSSKVYDIQGHRGSRVRLLRVLFLRLLGMFLLLSSVF